MFTKRTPLQCVTWPTEPWKELGIDIVGPIQEATTECRYIITLIDYPSKWPEIVLT